MLVLLEIWNQNSNKVIFEKCSFYLSISIFRLQSITFSYFRRATTSSVGLNRSQCTQWQISQFATMPRRSSYRPSRGSEVTRGRNTPPLASSIEPWSPNQIIASRAKSCHRRRSLGNFVRTNRSKSCITKMTVPTVTVWDGDTLQMTKTGEDIV